MPTCWNIGGTHRAASISTATKPFRVSTVRSLPTRFYRWEIILRESAIFGILGVATLGYYIDAAISEFRLDVAVVLILVTALLSMAVDAFSRGLRRRLRIDTMPTRLSETPSEPAIGRLVGAERPA